MMGNEPRSNINQISHVLPPINLNRKKIILNLQNIFLLYTIGTLCLDICKKQEKLAKKLYDVKTLRRKKYKAKKAFERVKYMRSYDKVGLALLQSVC